MPSKIYLDNAATTFIDESIKDSFNKAVDLYPGNPSSIHKFGQESSRIIEKSRGMILNSMSLPNHEVIFTSGATEANNLAIKGYCLEYKNRGRHIIVSEVEHASVLETVRQLEKQFGFEVSYAKINSEGKVSVEEIKSLLREDTILVSIMAVNNEIGAVNEIEKIGEFLKQFSKICFHVDAVQALGKIPLSYKDIDMITITGHKIHGFIGCGCLLKRKGLNIAPLITGGGQEYGLRSGTLSLPLISSFALSVKKAVENQQNSFEKVSVLSNHLNNLLNSLSDNIIHINSNINENPYILNFSLKEHKASVVVEALSNKDIYVSSISACHSNGEPISYVVKALTHDENLAHNTIRVSFDAHNTLEEIDVFFKTFMEIIGDIKQ